MLPGREGAAPGRRLFETFLEMGASNHGQRDAAERTLEKLQLHHGSQISKR